MLFLKKRKQIKMKFLFFKILELDSDFDSRDGSDNENENLVKYEVRILYNDIINMNFILDKSCFIIITIIC
jgi:hypothetical protein